MIEQRRKHIALLVAYGPEIKAFIHSGLAERLSKKYKVTILARLPRSAVFTGLDYCTVMQMPDVEETRALGKLRSWGLRTQLQWLRTRGRTHWTHYIPKQVSASPRRDGSRLLEVMGGSRAIAGTFSVIERWWGRMFGTLEAWRALFTSRNIDCLVTAGFSGPYVLPVLQTAANVGVKTIVVTNSWKDVYTTTKVGVVPNRLIVWNEQAAGDVCAMNPHVPKHRVLVAESLHLQLFRDPPPIMSREELCVRLGLDSGRPYLCYTAAAPAAVVNEELIVEAILNMLGSGDQRMGSQLVLRMNPMEDGSRWMPLKSRHPGLVLQKPQWEWIREADWCCALREDLPVWLAMVRHAAGNISIASTVTLEFAAFGKPVLNICFDLPEPQPVSRSNKRFWDADFYRDIRDHGLAQPVHSAEELGRLLMELPAAENRQMREALPRAESPTERIVDIIDGLLV